MPKKNYNIRQKYPNHFLITANLFEIKFTDDIHKLTLYNVEISPEVALDNYSLKRQIYSNIKLPDIFKKTFWAGNNLYAIITEEKDKSYEIIKTNEEINKTNYNIKLQKIKDISFQQIKDLNETNQREKSMVENIFRNIIMSNPKVIKFQDRTIFEIDPKNIINVNGQFNQNIYKGYITSAHITENGLFMQINNRNKYISGKTALQKMNEIRSELLDQQKTYKEIYDKINEFFYSHRTVITTYGSFKAYKIKEVNFDKCPNNTNITIKDINGNKRTISIINYYKNQYNIEIKEKTQPLLIAESKSSKNIKLLPSDKSSSLANENDYFIYLIPELVYITGIEGDDNQNKRRNNCRNINEKTKTNPAKKISEINGIFDLVYSNNRKTIKQKNGNKIELKSPKEIIEEWGIQLSENLTVPGTIIPQPKLFFNNKNIQPRNGIFRAEDPFASQNITRDNIFYVFDKNEKKYDHRQLFFELLSILFTFPNNSGNDEECGYGLDNTDTWDNILNSLRKINLNEKKCIGIIFCSEQLIKFYENLKIFL
jgi:hypothetical protein